MSVKASCIALVLFWSSLNASSPATASVLVAVASGTLSDNSFDDSHFFGSAENLSGIAAEITFTINTSQGILQSGPNYSVLLGGTVNSATSIGNAVVTINGISRSVPGDYNSMYYIQNNGAQSLLEPYFRVGPSPFNASDLLLESAYGNVYRPDNLIPLSIDAPPSGNLCVGAQDCTFYFAFGHHDSQGNFYNDAYGTLDATSFSIAAVPEPSTWAMMLLGFMTYRRNFQVVLRRA